MIRSREIYLPFKGKDTGNFDFFKRNFLLSFDSIGLKMTVFDIPFLEWKVRRQERINSRSEDDRKYKKS